jgi:hypothetical protein
MTLTIELTEEEAERLHKIAIERKTDEAGAVRELISDVSPALAPENAAAIALLDSWRDEDFTDDPNELAQRDADLQELKAGLNANRTANGERLLF